MAKFTINRDYSSSRAEIEAESFIDSPSAEFIDFLSSDSEGNTITVLRVKTRNVETIHRDA